MLGACVGSTGASARREGCVKAIFVIRVCHRCIDSLKSSSVPFHQQYQQKGLKDLSAVMTVKLLYALRFPDVVAFESPPVDLDGGGGSGWNDGDMDDVASRISKRKAI